MEIRRFQGLDFILRHYFYVGLCGMGLGFCYCTSNFQLSGIWKLLRHPDTDVCKVAIGVPRERSRASYAELLNHEVWVWAARHLRTSKRRSTRGTFRNVDGRIILLGFLDEHTQRRRLPGLVLHLARTSGCSNCSWRHKNS